MKNYYISSCVFTAQFPERSLRIRKYVQDRWGYECVRCCVPKYKIREFEEKMPDGPLRHDWTVMSDSGIFEPGDSVYSLCHNCNNIIEEMHPAVHVFSLWELISRDDRFAFPDYSGMEVTVQDCWRSRDRQSEQDAVRSLLDRMKIRWVEAPAAQKSETCSKTLRGRGRRSFSASFRG